MDEWQSYDSVAERYDAAWGPRFAAVAERLWKRVAPRTGMRFLDIGTGTGIVPRALGDVARPPSRVVGCDRSAAMLAVARRRLPPLSPVAADATRLPFAASAFDVVTASFVLSHLADADACLRDVRRVLVPGGVVVFTSWPPNDDPYTMAWNDLLRRVVSDADICAAVQRVAPSEARFDNAENCRETLRDAGFEDIRVEAAQFDCGFTLDEFVADREMAGAARYVQSVLDAPRWRSFREEARRDLQRAFGDRIEYVRDVLVSSGRRPPQDAQKK